MNQQVKIIENGFVVTCNQYHQNGYLSLLIQNGKIVDVGKPSQVLKSLYPNAEVIDASGKIIIPGFIDAHHNGLSFILKNFTAGFPFYKWNESQIKNAFDCFEDGADYDDFLKAYRLSYCAALKAGVTTIAEYGFNNPDYSLPASIEAMNQVNIKGIVGLHNGDQIEYARRNTGKILRYACVISNEENVTTYGINSTLRNAQELNASIILNLGQTKKGYDIIKKKFNKSILELYDDLGIFNHSVHLTNLACFDSSDIMLIKNNPLICSPSAIMDIGTDMPSFPIIMQNKISVALSSKWGMVLPLENIRTYKNILQLNNLYVDYPNLLDSHIINGAKALAIDKDFGTIEVGKKADLAFIDARGFILNVTLNNYLNDAVLYFIIQQASSQNICDVMINGEFYVREGNLLIYSEDDLINDQNYLIDKICQHSCNLEKKPAKVLLFNDEDALIQNKYSKTIDIEKIKNLSVMNTDVGEKNKITKKISKIFGDDE